MITLVATLRLRGNWWKLLAVWTYLYPQEVTLLLHLVALLLLTALLLLAALLEALPPLLLPHTAPLLQHSSPTPLLPCITRHRRLVFGCFVVRQPPPSSAGAIELARGQFLIFRENNPKIQKYFFKFLFSRIYTFHHEFLGFVFK